MSNLKTQSQHHSRPHASEQPLMRVENLSIGYQNKTTTLELEKNINLDLHKGKVICLLGQNGSGKSTLLRTLAGVENCLAGKVVLEGKDLLNFNKAELAQRLSLVLTEDYGIGNLSVYTLLSLGRYPYLGWFGLLTQNDRKIISRAIKSMGIEAYVDKNMHELSDGEQQKVMLARALVQDTPLIILDEPTAYLDIPSRIEVMHLLKKMVRETGKTVLLSSHELDLALQVADDIWLMAKDKPLCCGTPEDLIFSGSIADAFDKGSYRFCFETGTFKSKVVSFEKEISLEGEKVGAFWTRRALEREGYSIVENSDLAVTVELVEEGDEDNEDNVGSTRQWYVKQGNNNTRFTSVQNLLNYLQSQ